MFPDSVFWGIGIILTDFSQKIITETLLLHRERSTLALLVLQN